MKAYDDLLYAISGHPQFPFLVAALKSARPLIPAHDPLNDNTSQWKQKSAQQAGFDLCLGIFKINQE